ncbi:MAG: heme exporter protein CcmD [Acidimicrobiales bacterium]
MEYGEYVLGGYLVTALALGLYTVRLLRRGRSLSRQIPPEERRWS